MTSIIKDKNSQLSYILLTHFCSKAYFDPLWVLVHKKVYDIQKPYTLLSYLTKTLL
ncbi:hypothetical protein Hanom_Chr04g00309181 [Helianthus anomalus]